MGWPKRKFYESKRFGNVDDIFKYFKDCEETPLIDAIMFLAEQIYSLEEQIEAMDNEMRGYDP